MQKLPRKIFLTQGKIAIVDWDDYEELTEYRWCAGKYRRTYYAVRGYTKNHKHTTIKMHTQLTGKIGAIDHVDGDGLNNTRTNLRKANHSQNGANRRKQIKPTGSVHKGLYWQKDIQQWRVQLRHKNLTHYMGCFVLEKDAAKAYNEAAKRYFGEFARLNNLEE